MTFTYLMLIACDEAGKRKGLNYEPGQNNSYTRNRDVRQDH